MEVRTLVRNCKQKFHHSICWFKKIETIIPRLTTLLRIYLCFKTTIQSDIIVQMISQYDIKIYFDN